MKLTKLEQSLLLLFQIVVNIESTKALVEVLKQEIKNDDERKNEYLFIAYSHLYLFTYHFLKELKIFNRLKNDIPKVKQFLKETRSDLKELNRTFDKIVKYRNCMIGHFQRDKKKRYVHFLELTDVPNTDVEIFYFSDYCNCLFYVIDNLFKEELEIAKEKLKEFEKGAAGQTKVIDVAGLDQKLNELKKKYKGKYDPK